MRLIVLAGTIAVLGAQESTSVMPKNPPALQEALRLLSKMKVLPKTPVRLAMKPPLPNKCSAPLREIPLGKPEEYASNRVPVTEVEPMPQVAVPAPPCASR